MADATARTANRPLSAWSDQARRLWERTGAARVAEAGDVEPERLKREIVPSGFSGGAEAPAFAINGRFYGQALTGVQRYGHEIVRALDPQLRAAGRTARLMLPRDAVGPADHAALAARPARFWQGQAWEQGALPLAAGLPILNLCNTGPLAGRRQVVCMHDTNVLSEPGSYRAAFRLYYRVLQPLLARRAAVLTTVSRASASALAAWFGLDRRRIAVLPNGHEHALAWRRDDAILARHALVRPFVLVIGSRARHKNLPLLLRLAPALDDLGLDLVVAGRAGPVFATGVAASGGNVRRVGAVSDSELAGLLAHALCLAFPSWTEGFGLPIVEAMARGCPVVASDRASMPEICGSAALMAAPDDPAAWLTHIAALAGSTALRRELADRGAVQARRFSWTASARGYLALMEAIA